MGHGLRHVLAPTTDFRSYYDALGSDPLAERILPAVQLAITAARRSRTPPWAPHLQRALRATAQLASAAADFAAPDSLWSRVAPAPAAHPTGLPGSDIGDRSCGTCAWKFIGGRGRQVARCRQADDARVDPRWPGCTRWEPTPDCQDCGACCRAAYHSVTIPRRDPVRELHPELVVDRGQYIELRRSGDRCAALAGGRVDHPSDPNSFVPFRCLIYPDRPKPCREFDNSGEHCLTARRRVGLSL
ncbi:MAG: YkgJ family cysteine cluster protein [Deltaproteobacteria bacterium]|nr:YkgJ family cysteine cluster protein [Deltaproteobacteria bacterium]